MLNLYQVILDRQSAKRFRTHLNNMGVGHIGSECGGFVCIQFQYNQNEIADIRVLLDEVKCYFWAKNALKNKK